MNPGTIIDDRYVLESPVDSRIPFAESWRAHDRRLGLSVLVLLIAEEGRRGFHDLAESIRTTRHPRLTRIIGTGLIESSDMDLAGQPFIVFDEPKGTRLTDLLDRYRLPTPAARALAGEALKSVEAAASLGLRHGSISPHLLTVTDRGRVLLTGAGIVASLVDSDPSREPVTDRDDARSLVRCFIQAATGIDPDKAEPDDLPGDLTRAEKDLSLAVLDSSARPSLVDVAQAFSSWNLGALRDLSIRRSSFPRLPTVPEAIPVLEEAPVLVEAPVFGKAPLAEAPSVEAPSPAWPPEALEEGLVEEGWGLQDFEEVLTVKEAPTIAEAIFGFLHRRFPSWSLGRILYERARDRTLAGPRFDATPWFLLLGFIAVVVVGILAISWTTGPFTPTVDLNNLPSHEYPPYTFGPTADPSPDF